MQSRALYAQRHSKVSQSAVRQSWPFPFVERYKNNIGYDLSDGSDYVLLCCFVIVSDKSENNVSLIS